jgi:transmembrane sensor
MALAAAFALALVLPQPRPVAPDYATQVAEIRDVHLADGSVVTLGAATGLEVAFTSEERRVRIADGEAYFRVTHEAARPFFVEANGAVVRVVGTEFEVKATADLVRVSVARGVVEVAERVGVARLLAPPRTHRLTAGEELVIARDGATPVAVIEAPRPPASWRDGFLTYERATLSEVIADANRYSSMPIRIADPALVGLLVTASYPTDRLDQMLASLDAGLPVDVERTAGEIRITAAQ